MVWDTFQPLRDKVRIDDLFNGSFAKFKDRSNFLKTKEYVYLEVSPVCDYAQDKWIACRLLSGILWPLKYKKKVKQADYIYKSPVIEFKNKLFYLVFDFRSFTSVRISVLKTVKPIFRIRKSLLVDIQCRLSRHINRPGVVSIE